MKKCTSCAKDLPDAALHCVFCGAKQPPVAAASPAGANAKTVMGWQASDVLKDLAAQGHQVPPNVVGAPPPAAPPPAAMPIGIASTLAAPPPAAPPLGIASTLVSPPPGGGPPPPATAQAATMFQQAPVLPPQNLSPPARPASDAATMFQQPAVPIPQASSPYAPLKTLPAPSAYDGPSSSGFGGGYNSPAAGQGPGGFGAGPLPGAGMPPGAGFPQPGGPLPGAGMPPGGGFPPPQQPNFGAPPPGFPPPPQQQPNFGAPPPGFPPQPNFAPPPPSQPFQPQPNFQQPNTPGGFGGPPGGYNPVPVQQQGMSPPYLASRTAARAGAPREPYAEGLRLVLIIFGVLLIAAFVAPMSMGGKMVFRWDLLKAPGVGALAKFDQVYLAAAGILALVFGLVPLATVPRGALAAVLGLMPIALHFVIDDLKNAPSIQWQEIVGFIGAITLVPGLMLREEYRSQMLPRILTTVGALCVLLPMFVPHGGDPPIKGLIDAISKGEGKLKVLAILKLWPVIIAALSLLCWLPAPSSGAAKILAWLFIITLVVYSYTALLIAGHMGAAIKAHLNDALLGGWVAAAWIAFIGYGAATVFGKNLEHA